MSDGIFKIVTCDRCGFEKRVTKNDDEWMIRLPLNWGSASIFPLHWDLCPSCYDEFKVIVKEFVKGDNDE